MKSRQQITVRVHHPETVEGMELLKKSQATVMINILEKQLGEKKVEELFEYMKKKTQQT
ncbi:hypothetical protein CLPUN_45400 [Clostridium puniceum]|uniref:Uncharacterized protein n=1 Tax=Clostridium puniceum TaxID=29367 RepID=A0A1S8T6V8_9CLOT|nr:hypothetical protein [Clostridium puniceum]OOM73517.1 hypothetical protein CLPUN_45400 [Clostridium puniceum]